MKYNFDEIVDRKNSNCMKWDRRKEIFGDNEILPMWIADMDFNSPPEVVEAIENRVKHRIYGYTYRPDSYYDSIIRWMEIRHNWKIDRDWITFSPGIVPALSLGINAYSRSKDSVIIQTPVYPPFRSVVDNNERTLICNNLKLIDGRYEMDLDNLRKQIRESNENGNMVKILLLCNPHNPGGRVWTREELLELGNICLENNIIIISDEIHSDIIYEGYKHIPIASLSEDIQNITITCISPSKTFNLAGLSTSAIIIPNEELREAFNTLLRRLDVDGGNIFGTIALETAYSKGENWLEELLVYLEDNRNYLLDFIQREIPSIKPIIPEGGYLVWLNCEKLGIKGEELFNFFAKKAKVGLNSGARFGGDGDNYVRLNIACPKDILIEGLNRIKKVVDEYFK